MHGPFSHYALFADFAICVLNVTAAGVFGWRQRTRRANGGGGGPERTFVATTRQKAKLSKMSAFFLQNE